MNDVKGVNSRLDPLQAAILAVKLPHLDAWNARRAGVAARYHAALGDVGLTLPFVPAWADPAWHLFVVGAPDRAALAASLEQAGVQTLIHYPIAPHLQIAYAEMNLARGSLPIAEGLADEVLSLPISPHLGTDEVERVIAAVRSAQAPA